MHLLNNLPSTTPTAKLFAERYEEGIPIICLANEKPFQFAFQCDTMFDSSFVCLPLRLATYGLLGEHCLVQQDLVWSRSTSGVLGLISRSCKWTHSHNTWDCVNSSNFQNVGSINLLPRPTSSNEDHHHVPIHVLELWHSLKCS